MMSHQPLQHFSPQALFKWILFYQPFMLIAIILISLIVTLFGLTAPVLQKLFFDQLSQGHFHQLFFLGSAASIGCYFLLHQFLNLLSQKLSLRIQKNLSQSLYQYLLSLPTSELGKKNIGQLVSVYATDIPSGLFLIEANLPQGLNILFPLILAPVVLNLYFHVPELDLLISLSLFVAVTFFLATRQSFFFKRFKELSADRIGIINEWIQNIKTIRLLNLGNYWENKIKRARIDETRNRIKMLSNGQTMNTLSSSMTFILTAYFLYRSRNLEPSQILGIFWIVAVFWTRPFRQLPWFFTLVFDGWTSIKRLSETFHLSETYEKKACKIKAADKTNDDQSTEERIKLLIESLSKQANIPFSLKVKNLNLKLEGKHLLKNITFSIEKGQTGVIFGPVGSGKTLLLLSLLGETPAVFENYSIGNIDLLKIQRKYWKLFYSILPQDSFIISSTIRDNLPLCFNTPLSNDESCYQVLQQACFDLKSERIPNGLDTLVGERGVTLSGGQKQRLNLARMFYHARPIQLWDDALGALDIHTLKQILVQLIQEKSQDQINIIVTNKPEFSELANVQFHLVHGELREIREANKDEFRNLF